jgi:hypothetical protein
MKDTAAVKKCYIKTKLQCRRCPTAEREGPCAADANRQSPRYKHDSSSLQTNTSRAVCSSFTERKSQSATDTGHLAHLHLHLHLHQNQTNKPALSLLVHAIQQAQSNTSSHARRYESLRAHTRRTQHALNALAAALAHAMGSLCPRGQLAPAQLLMHIQVSLARIVLSGSWTALWLAARGRAGVTGYTGSAAAGSRG